MALNFIISGRCHRPFPRPQASSQSFLKPWVPQLLGIVLACGLLPTHGDVCAGELAWLHALAAVPIWHSLQAEKPIAAEQQDAHALEPSLLTGLIASAVEGPLLPELQQQV